MNSENIIDDFPNNGKIYLNNASVSLLPSISLKAMTNFLVAYNSLGPDSFESNLYLDAKLYSVRKTVSEIIKCRPEEIIFTQSTTDGVNIVANGLEFHPNANMVIRGGAHEHHANYYPWLQLGKHLELRNLSIDDNGLFDMSQLEGMIDNNTHLVALSHALYNTGAILPIKGIGKILKEKNIPFFVDAAQTVGCIGNFDVRSIDCDFMSFNGSKWLCGPMGTGLFYCKKDSSKLLEPSEIGGESAMIYDSNKLAFKDIPDKFQTGFRNYAGMVGLEASVNYLSKYGLENIRNKVMNLANQLRDELAKISGTVIYGPQDPNLRTSIVSFNLSGHDAKTVVEKLERQKIILAEREIFEKKIVRASPHFFNTENEIQKLVDAIKCL
jgi:cysteine desulfurase/selenocysteine lyase